ncbi:MAG: lytic transglycosylase domain-containing protein [Bacteriovoracaceae bacterium]|nr:lytic transglycosylase domain-containing protein [Bacteriovoracaceae bacterium]
MKQLILPFIFVLLAGCATDVVRPPEGTPISKLSGPQVEGEQYAWNYYRGGQMLKLKKGDRGCSIFTELKKEKRFPLQVLAEIKYLRSCPVTKTELLQFWETKDKEIPRWALEYYVVFSLELAKDYGIRAKEAHFSNRLAKYKRLRSEKIPLIKHAIKLAPQSDRLEYEKALEKIAPRYIEKKTPKTYYQVARDYERIRKFKVARKYYRKIIRNRQSTIEEKLKSWKRYCLSHKMERDRAKYVDCFGRQILDLKKELSDKRILYDRMISYARALWTIERTKIAKKVLLEVIEAPEVTGEQIALVHRALSGMAQEKRYFKKAISHIKVAIEQTGVSKDTREKLLWQLGWSFYIDKNYTRALNVFEILKLESESNFTKMRITFWQGKIHKILENNSKSDDKFEELIDHDTFGYYGLMAHKEMGKSLSPMNKFEDYDKTDYRGTNTLEWLLYAREWNMAKRYLRFMSYGKKNREEVENKLPLYYRGRAYDYGIFLFYKIEAEKRNESLKEYASLVFPMPFEKQITASAKRFNIKKEYIYSIIRQESAFNAKARSFADAFGLMQVIPKRAEELSKRLEIPYRRLNDLYNPDINVPIGTAILKKNLDRYKGNFVKSTASYNAGDTPVKRWFEERFNGDYLEFIEMIPYEETRSYVRLVLRNYLNYKRFTEKESFIIKDSIFTNF